MALSEPAKPWTIMGDFNVVFSIDDPRGTRRTLVREYDEFVGMDTNCDLTQLEHMGLYFT